ncbi:hypothetical protein [Zhouia amylolytica]|uniref:Viral A-type inclusion protein n=1 Tax=Zhouia amylolytica AD3 TaxID=1286632 RepID=W2UMD4_9FLAO|nr:hypothetical protein [Zhouia amylolytica]ETN94626.1 hypothetical protein P278_25690 [Zhouia amylolytica AD3]
MKTIKTAFSLFALLLMISCGNDNSKQEVFDSLKKEVLKVHDEVMPKMGKINTLITELDSKIDTTEMGKSYEKAKQELEESHDMMMSWMKNFGDQFGGTIAKDSLDKKIQLLEQEDIKVNDLKEKINSSIKNAEDLLGNQ